MPRPGGPPNQWGRPARPAEKPRQARAGPAGVPCLVWRGCAQPYPAGVGPRPDWRGCAPARTGGGAPPRDPAGLPPPWGGPSTLWLFRAWRALGISEVCLLVDGRTRHVHTRTHVYLTCTRRAFSTVFRAFDSIFGEHVHLTFLNPSASCVVSNASPDIEFRLSGVRIFTVDRPFECHTPARSRLTRGLKPVHLRCLSGGGRVLFPDFCGFPGDFAARGLFKSRYFRVQHWGCIPVVFKAKV
ncbi:hypothetical protein Taro_033201 [Colocasia esculenta]|uniref:Uncharacterized protein n=1 Tax=Colocasia esculenta TaxID=4460 RepID=A0A843VX57_COLES|nr:hypothetical protein [Colocasia esculenta]